MSLEEDRTIDAIGVELASDCVVLSIIDSWGWEDEGAHLLALQTKLNGYLEFIASGQLTESYPKAVGRHVRIELISKFPLPDLAERFLARAREVAAGVGIDLRQRVSEIG